MVTSKTKYIASEAEIKELFSFHKIGNVIEISPLGNGEFNAVYKVVCEAQASYALKIAPPDAAGVLSYEKNMLESEVFWYGQMHDKTDIFCPCVIVCDYSKRIIKSSCFIMEMMEGEPIGSVILSPEEYEKTVRQKIGMLTKIHRISNDCFGYIQTSLADTWYEALKNMASSLVADCNRLGYETPDGERFIRYIDKYRNLLEEVPCRMVNFDLWDSNILYNSNTGKICWIDPERCFWGDPVADFITLGPGQKVPLSAKSRDLEIYNEMAQERISLTDETQIRYALAVCYLALIEEVEKYVRYEPDHPNYIRNTVDSREMYNMAFSILE